MSKTAASELQEMLIKMELTPEYEYSQTGPPHQAVFNCCCIACGEQVTAQARSKKEAKQEAARTMLDKLSKKGHSVLPPYGKASDTHNGKAAIAPEATSGLVDPSDIRMSVALLREFCVEYHLPTPSHEPVGTGTGPPHARLFTERVSIGPHERLATATTKKAARQMAARDLYLYLRDNLVRVTKDFNEEQALARDHDRVMKRHKEEEAPTPRRPDLGQRVADYPMGLTRRLEPMEAPLLKQGLARKTSSPERVVAELAEALRLQLSYRKLQRVDSTPLHVLELGKDLAFAAPQRSDVAEKAITYLRASRQEANNNNKHYRFNYK